MFNYELLPPDDSRTDIIAEYQDRSGGPRFDLDGASSGFLQVLLILQGKIYDELRKIARESHSQLLIATQSDIVINAIEPRGLLAMPGHPPKLADDHRILR